MKRFNDAHVASLNTSGSTRLADNAASRRRFITTTLAGAAALALYPARLPRVWAAEPAAASASASTPAATGAPTPLAVVRRTIEVNGRAASVYGVVQPNGAHGIRLTAGDAFDVALRNDTDDATLIHWHGLTPPWNQDGVPDAPMPLLAARAQQTYRFPVNAPGTYWMHAHTLQEQQLLAAPLIVADPADSRRDEQEVVVMLHDFSFKSPEELLAGLTKGGQQGAAANAPAGHGAMSGQGAMGSAHAAGGMNMSGMQMQNPSSTHGTMAGMDMGDMGHMGDMSAGMPMDLNDIDYDAYLANERTLADPEIVKVERGGRVRLRIINGATATAFTVDLGGLSGALIAVDGQPVQPVMGRRFPVSMGQRIDVRLQLPSEARAFPILALREGARERTGIVLQPAGAPVRKMAATGSAAGPVLDLALESRLRAAAPLLQRRPANTFKMTLMGDMAAYRWALATQPRIEVERGERVEVTMRNASMMAHPMHLHGHHFQVVAIDGRRFNGAVRDTVLLPPGRSVTIAVDANNPGQWAFHCHHLYHMAAGMMTTFAYRA
ncbi:multicopper oxidase family protein [Paraburkholderia kururiensis]|uniref:Multicopper oxidase domain-containing protein n=1 Tax=Paraburkholderia kururiensis TaxID=984307 RepID=A0ABZ0WJQ6_9BURK|nr:multicopper oxidase domain-containing protein [Paraburkholderia kururiensis]WQD77573.1 multicopper oxidase domain-containing protein [Paraburkholderia kururiensis]